MNRRRAVIAAFDAIAVALLIWLAWAQRAPIAARSGSALDGEEELYDRYAVPWARGEGTWPRDKPFAWHPLGSVTHRPSGYVVFLGVIYRLAGDRGVTAADQARRLLAVRYAQAALDTASVVLVYMLGVLAFAGLLGRAVGFTAAVGLSHYDFLAQFVGRLLAETPFVFLMLVFAVVALLARRRDRPALSALAAYVLVWANLFRTFLLFALPGYLAWLAIAPGLARRRAHLALALVAMALGLLPVVWRNWQFHHAFVLISTNSGYTLYHGLQQIEGLSAPEELGSEEAIKELGLGELAEQDAYRRLATDYLRRHVEDWPRIAYQRLKALLAAKGGYKISHQLMVTPDDEWFYPLVLVGALLSLVVQPRRSWPARLLVWLLIASQLLTALLAQAEVRYRVPVVPLLALLAAWALWGTLDMLASRVRPRLAAEP